jgi:hypothetical protein
MIRCTSNTFPTTLRIENKKCRLLKGNIIMLGPWYGFTVEECVNEKLYVMHHLDDTWVIRLQFLISKRI